MTLIHSGSASLVSFSALRTSQGFQCVSSPGSWVAHTPATIQGWHPDAARVGHLPLELSGLPEVAKKSVPNAERREGLGDVPVIAPRGAGGIRARTEPGTARHTRRSGRVLVLVSPQVSALTPTFCKFVYRATSIFNLAPKDSERQDNR